MTVAEAELVTPKKLRAPFPWFGGKSRVAHIVWDRFGKVPNYVEPFFGSGAVLLGRPHEPRIETVNDKDLYIANFWRALKHAPAEVAKYCDDPVNEADLHARHLWLVNEGRKRLQRIKKSPTFYDARIAGWWVWGQALWIGSGWCADHEWDSRKGSEARPTKKRPARTGNGQGCGVHRVWNKKPHTNRRGGSNGVHRSGLAERRWQGGGQGGGSGVHAPSLWKQPPDLSGSRGAAGRGIHASGLIARTGGLELYLHDLSVRLRRVRVCVGDWRRVLTESVTTYIGVTAVFLDPPYDQSMRSILYAQDKNISGAVREWALANGDNPSYRIALCGYEGEHNGPNVANPIPSTWECVKWKAHGGYSRSARGVANRDRERIWFSPHCLKAGTPRQAELPQFEDRP